ncbi:conjugal transfer protein [Shouchella sp. JSM 1781072]|uniref:conjugal transfer protein n=1 Tax=Shouchella sp. JSM 1781072 TaxID=3344581 RepID=UPI0035C0B578
MRTVFNYRKALREPKKVQQLTASYSLPIPFELIPVINFFIFMAMTFLVGQIIRMGFPHAFERTFVMWLIGLPLALTILVTKIKPEGKNIYLYFLDVAKYYVQIKLPKKRFCNDREVEWMSDSTIQFKRCVKVVAKKREYIKNTNENDEEQSTVNENGRRVGVLPHQESVHSHAK